MKLQSSFHPNAIQILTRVSEDLQKKKKNADLPMFQSTTATQILETGSLRGHYTIVEEEEVKEVKRAAVNPVEKCNKHERHM